MIANDQNPQAEAQAAAQKIKVGDKVSFVLVRRNHHSTEFSNKQGIVERLQGKLVHIKARGRLYAVSLDVVRPLGQMDALTEALLAGPYPEARHG